MFSPGRLLSTAALVSGVLADVVVIPGGLPKPYTGPGPVKSADEFFRKSIANEFNGNSAEVLFSSFDYESKPLSAGDGIRPTADSFVRGAIQAWGEHLHLVIRPEEVWFTILVQMNFYMQSHAEEVRDIFVDHEGKETIRIEDTTWWKVLIRFQEEIQARVKTEWLRKWMIPDFSTTTPNDIMTANILMMGLTKAYFNFEGGIICGLPSVTLSGTKSDWQALLQRLEMLPEFGKEPAEYAERLEPILSRFVSSFDEPDSTDTKFFWNNIVAARKEFMCGAPPFYLSGWVTGFYYWDDQGQPYARNTRPEDLQLDSVQYPFVDIRTLPVAYASAPFTMLDFNGTARFEAFVLAGTLGKKISNGPPSGYQQALERTGSTTPASYEGHTTLQPLSAWVMYGPKSHEDPDSRWQRETELGDLVESIESNFDICRSEL